MDITLSEDQESLRGLAAEIFAKRSPVARVEEVEATGERFDRVLWEELGRAGLLGIALPEDAGGAGLGLLEASLVCTEQGRVVAPVPLVWTLAAAGTLAARGGAALSGMWPAGVGAGTAVLTCPAPASGRFGVHVDEAGRLSGTIAGVPYAHVADAVLVPVGADVYLVDPVADGVTVRPGPATSREIHGELALDGAAATRLDGPDAADDLERRLLVLLSALSAGVTAAALRLTAEYTSGREQFGKPLSAFQGVALKAADAYVDTVAIASTAHQAAWRVDRGEDARAEVLTAAWWAAEGGQHCVHLTQHLHGGMGADVTYPVHRYFLWGKQIELLLGGASALLGRLGDTLVALDNPGDSL